MVGFCNLVGTGIAPVSKKLLLRAVYNQNWVIMATFGILKPISKVQFIYEAFLEFLALFTVSKYDGALTVYILS